MASQSKTNQPLKDESNILMGKQPESQGVEQEPLHQSMILPGMIKQRHIGENCRVVQFGDDADLPDGTSHTKAYFATDTNKLYLYNGTAWVSVTLS
jgi:hypothetical protein